MKKLLLAGAAMALLTTAASAADLPRRAEPPVFVPIPVFSWTGFYAGLHSAYAFTDNQNIRTTGNALATQANVNAGFRPASLKSEVDGFSKIGGGMGVNYQLTPGTGFVVGAAFDISWTDLQKNVGFVGGFNPVATGPGNNASVYTQNLDYLGTLNGKLGYAFDRFLVYGTGGLAFGNVSYGATFFGTQGNVPAFPTQFTGGYDVNFETGYNYGGGVEYAIPADSFLSSFSVGRLLGLKSDVTIKAEYIRYDLGGRSISVLNAAGGGYTSRFSTEGSIVRAGFNYKFGG
ncbi:MULTISPECIES: outer membrane protein [Methylobacterium]|uniref:Porin n=1 Tax=Methylobacterium thuringiense TaxID=1003091 RepID=A0ABQ4TLC8_9HYPH|nr:MULTISPECIES: porin family protein [Methylobacterium]TXN22256.1 porin family protein [Methylobacterium sp. WL9]GJE54623.1 hypothetical protein EKPJFOCH_1101 [Methylobacterium thuringiense]